MCGILALVGSVDNKVFDRALDLQAHRGPDGRGVDCVDGIMLGHRRLSIIDLSVEASQPMSVVNGEVTGVFNGEIYNYLELRKELAARGYSFKTQSDTEVLFSAFHCFGHHAVDKLIGMFSFVIYDKRKKALFVGRDRLGIKPLYYKHTRSGLCFSSEVKSIQEIDGSSGQLDLASVSAYFSYRYPLTSHSFVDGIHQLEPGHILVLNDGQLKKSQYWDFADQTALQEEDLGEDHYQSKLQELFASAVEYRMISDVPVGAYLSGGVDSSAVVAGMAKAQKGAVKTFTIGFEEDGFNEFEFSREVAEQYQTDHQEILMSKGNYFDNLEELIRIKDAPLGVPNEVPLYLMSKELKKKVTVVLSGEGADEIFGGYGRLFRSADDFGILGLPVSERPDTFTRKYGRRVFKDELAHFLFLYQYTDYETKKLLLGAKVDVANVEAQLTDSFRQAFNRVRTASYTTKMMYAFERLHLPGLLQRVDATTMGASVEARVPFVDHRLVEFAFSIPDKYKMKWNSKPKRNEALTGDQVSEAFDVPKYILKKAFEGDLSNNILYRKKVGFPVPLSSFMSGNTLNRVRELLLNGELVNGGVLNKSYLEKFLLEPNLKTHKNAMTAWMAYNLELYHRSCL